MRPWSAAPQLWPLQVSPWPRRVGDRARGGAHPGTRMEGWARPPGARARPARAGRLSAPLEPCFPPAAPRTIWQTEGVGSPGRRGDRRALGLCRSASLRAVAATGRRGPVPSAASTTSGRGRMRGVGRHSRLAARPAALAALASPGPGRCEHLETGPGADGGMEGSVLLRAT